MKTRARSTTILRLLCDVFALVVAAALTGCASLDLDSGQKPCVSNGVTYGVTKGTFRGRWWNYYERGRSFLDGGFYDQAARDLDAAVKGRSRDQFWARTYGLHLVPDYFPNRELGVAYYHQDKIEESIKQLELGLSQCYTARTAYYLGEARRKWLETTGKDTAAPAITITAPAAGAPVGGTQVELRGVVRDDTFVAGITINGEAVDVRVSAPEVSFSQVVPLRPGQNTVEIAARDLTGKTSSSSVPIADDADGPVVSFDGPVAVPGALRGVAFDPSGVASMQVSGKPANLTQEANGAVAFNLDLVRDDLNPPVRYECADELGNVTTGTLPLDLLVLSERVPDVILAAGTSPIVSLGHGLRGLLINGQLAAVAAAPAPAKGVQVAIANLEDGQQYFADEIVVALNINGENPIQGVELNGEPVQTIPGRNSLHVCRKIRLNEGENQLLAKATDQQGASGTDQKTVQRQVSAIEMDKGKLAIAFLGALTTGENPKLAEDAEYILNELSSSKPVQKRFTVVDRAMLKDVLAEQDLSAALASKKSKLALGKLVPAEMMITMRVRRDQESIEIVLEGASTETAVRTLPQVDVAGPYAELDRLIEDLGVRLVQEVPRAQGTVMQWASPEITTDLNATQGVRDSLKCLVFRTENVVNPNTGEVLGAKPIIVGEGLIDSVSQRFSTAQALPTEENPDVAKLPIEPGQYVVIK